MNLSQFIDDTEKKLTDVLHNFLHSRRDGVFKEGMGAKYDDGIVKAFIRQTIIDTARLMKEEIELEKEDEGGRQSREQANTWYEDNPYNIGFNEAVKELNQKVDNFMEGIE